MRLFSHLYGSEWEESGRVAIPKRPQPHYETLAEQVMANRNEVIALHEEVHRLSQDLTQAMVLNRSLVKLLIEQGVIPVESLQGALAETLEDLYPPIEESTTPSRFCDECGRPFAYFGQKCAFCSEVPATVPSTTGPNALEEQSEPSQSGENTGKNIKSALRTKKNKKKAT